MVDPQASVAAHVDLECLITMEDFEHILKSKDHRSEIAMRVQQFPFFNLVCVCFDHIFLDVQAATVRKLRGVCLVAQTE